MYVLDPPPTGFACGSVVGAQKMLAPGTGITVVPAPGVPFANVLDEERLPEQ